MKILVKISFDYDDEFVWSEHDIVTNEEWSEFNKVLSDKRLYNNFEYYFGTNQSVVFESYNDLMRNIDTYLVTEEDFLVLSKYEFNGDGLVSNMLSIAKEYLEELDGE